MDVGVAVFDCPVRPWVCRVSVQRAAPNAYKDCLKINSELEQEG